MEKTTIDQVKNFGSTSVTLQGWIYNARSSGKIAFLQLRDGTGFIQLVAEKSNFDDTQWDALTSLGIETSVEVVGIIKEDTRSDLGFEMGLESLTVLQGNEEYPISKKEHGPDFLLENRHLWIRSQRQWAIMRIRDGIMRYIEEFLRNDGFIRFDSPIFTPNAAEGTTELFEVDYFGTPAYLAQTGQLYAEAGIMSLRKVYDFGPVFRAEKSKTRRHLIEFWMMDAEMAFADHEENKNIQERLVIYVLENILQNYSLELSLLERDMDALRKAAQPFIRKTYLETVEELQGMGSDIKVGDDLGADDETILTQKYEQPIIVEKYPAEVKAFYMKKDMTDAAYVLNNDILAPEGYGEIIGGSQREEDIDILLDMIKKEGLKQEDFEWYLDLRRFGSVPHAGFGIGLERMVAWICGIQHVRESIPFPRLLNRLRP